MRKMPSNNSVIPANAGIQFLAHFLDFRLRGNDDERNAPEF